jgi:hypothetical protein
MALDPPALSSHPLLDAKAKELATANPDRFAEEVNLAADLLGVSTELYEGADEAGLLDTLDRAVVLQLNYQLLRGMSPLFVVGDAGARQGESRTYRNLDEILVNPIAVKIIGGIAEIVFPEEAAAHLGYNLGPRSLRTNRSGGGWWWDRAGDNPNPAIPWVDTRPQM